MSSKSQKLLARQLLADSRVVLLDPQIEVASESALERVITSPRLQKPGLAIAGFLASVRAGRVQVLGASEADFLETLPRDIQEKRVEELVATCPPLIMVAKGLKKVVDLFAPACSRFDVVLAQTQANTSEVIERLSSALEVLLAPRTQIHGDLLDIFAIGVLVTGESGLGKSECALELIYRGHRLVADDVVEVFRIRHDQLIGQAPPEVRGIMEVRGLGIISIDQLFGAAAVRDWKPVDLVVRLFPEKDAPAERLGLEQKTIEILGVAKPLLSVPVAAGRTLSLLVECAARRYLLQQRGVSDLGRTLVEAHEPLLGE